MALLRLTAKPREGPLVVRNPDILIPRRAAFDPSETWAAQDLRSAKALCTIGLALTGSVG